MLHPRKHRAAWRRKMALAGAVVGLGLYSDGLRADTTAEWIGGTGTWATASDWSTNPNVPNNGTPSGTNYQVLIDQPGSAAYRITQNGTASVDLITLSSTNATLRNSGALTIGGMNITAGIFQPIGGTLSGGTAGATITLTSPSQFLVNSINNGTWNNLTFAGSDLNVAQSSSQLQITNGLNLTGKSLNLSALNVVTLAGSQTLDDLAVYCTSTYGAQLQLSTTNSTQTVTFGSNCLIHGNITINCSGLGSTVVNNGTISADLAGGLLTENGDYFVNNGLMQAVNGGTLSFTSPLTNAAGAVISANNSVLDIGTNAFQTPQMNNLGTITTVGASTVNLSGTFTLAALGNYTPSPQTITNINGTLDNTGNTLTLAGVPRQWLLWGTILNGNLNCGTNMYTVTGTLNGVTNDPGNVIDVQYLDYLTMAGSWNNLGIIQATGAATINLGGSFTPTNIGTLNISPSTYVNITGALSNGGNNFTWPIGIWGMNGGTIYGGELTVPSGQQFTVYTSTSSATLDGVTIAPNSNITINQNANLILTDGTINYGNISGTGQLVLKGNVSPTAIGNVNLTGSNYANGVLLLGNMNLAAGQSYQLTSAWLLGGTITGGTIIATPANPFNVGYVGLLDGVTLDTPDIHTFNSVGNLYIQNNLAGVGQSLIDTEGLNIRFDGASQHINDFTIANQAYNTTIFVGGSNSSGPVTLTIDSNAALTANAYLSVVGSGSQRTLINNGLLSVNGNGSGIGIGFLDSFVNNSTMMAAGGTPGQNQIPESYSLSVGSGVASFTNNGVMEATSGRTILINAQNSTNAPGGLIAVSNTAVLQWYGNGLNQGLVSVNQGEFDIDPGFVNNGTISLQNSLMHAYTTAHNQLGSFNLGDGTLTGSGTINGSLVLSPDPSQLAFHIGGSNQGSYDSLTVNGSVSLAGDLDISFSNGFQNSINSAESFIVLTTGTNILSGAFDNVANGGRLEATDGYGSFEVDYGTGVNADQIVLSDFVATPEPSSMGLLVGSAFLLARRRKRQLRGAS